TKKQTYEYYVSDDRFELSDDREGYLYSIKTKNFRSSSEEENSFVDTTQEDVSLYTGRDAYGRMISQTNLKGATTIYDFDTIGQLVSVTSPPIVINDEGNL
ncbi:MAG: hypothetical protein NE330_08580, partial [Lentisphaeraceae bacterium]|nr:hypothetical protein [Lentisphaeraceae bacterium]